MAARIIENVKRYDTRIWAKNSDGIVCFVDYQNSTRPGRFIISYHTGYHLPAFKVEFCVSPDRAERIARKFEPDLRRWHTRG